MNAVRGERGRKAVFFDRDGTLISDVGYLHDPALVSWKDGAIDAIRTLRDDGYVIILVTNQSGIGRGMFDTAEVDAVHARMRVDLAANGTDFDAIYYCPHAPDAGCSCRKPLPGLLEQAAEELNIDLASSWLMGDQYSDIAAGAGVGVRSIYLGEGDCPPKAIACDDSIRAAMDRIRAIST